MALSCGSIVDTEYVQNEAMAPFEMARLASERLRVTASMACGVLLIASTADVN
jgi:hypothetical protein